MNKIIIAAVALISLSSGVKVEKLSQMEQYQSMAQNQKYAVPGGWKVDNLVHFNNGHITSTNGGDTQHYDFPELSVLGGAATVLG